MSTIPKYKEFKVSEHQNLIQNSIRSQELNTNLHEYKFVKLALFSLIYLSISCCNKQLRNAKHVYFAVTNGQ